MENIKMRTGLSIAEEPSDNIKTFMLVFMAIIWRRVWITTAIYCEHNKIGINRNIVLKALKYNIFAKTGIGNTLKPYIVKAFTDGFLMPHFYEQNIYATRAIKLYKPAYAVTKLRSREAEMKFLKDYAFSAFDIENKIVNEVVEESKDVIKDIDQSEGSNQIIGNINISDSNNSDSNNSDSNNSDNELDSSDNSNDLDNNSNDLDNNSNDLDNNSNDNSDNNDSNSLFPVNTSEKCNCKMCELVNIWDINVALFYSEDPFQNIAMKGLMSALEETNY